MTVSLYYHEDGAQGATHSQPLCIIRLARGEEGLERVVARDNETGEVGQELTTEVEDDQEEVEADQTEDGISLGDSRGLLEIDEEGVLGELMEDGSVSRRVLRESGRMSRYLSVKLSDVLLNAVLGRRHSGDVVKLLR